MKVSLRSISYGWMCMVLFIGCFLFPVKGQAQDPHFSQFYANPLYINPAFAGAAECPRLSLSYRNQWPNMGGGFSVANVAYDQHINAIAGGLGVLVNTDIQSGGAYINTMASLIYSYRFHLGKSTYLRLAAQASYVNRRINWNGLTFPDQYDPLLGLVRPTAEPIIETPISKSYADFSTGALVYGKNFYAGFAVNHLTRPDEGFTAIRRLSMKYTLHVGGIIYFTKTYDQKRKLGELSLSPNIIYTQQGKMEDLCYGLYMNVYPMVFGLWFRQNFSNADALVGLVGAEFGNIKVGYSYDLNLSKLKGTGGAHEITLVFIFKCPEKKRRISSRAEAVPCPRF